MNKAGKRLESASWVALTLLAAAACEPASITDARDQLQRGGERTFALSLPVAVDTIVFADFLPEDIDTVIEGVLGAKIDQQFFTVPAVDSFVVPIEFSSDELEFGDFESAMREVIVNAAPARLVLDNANPGQMTIVDFVLGVVRLNPNGSIPLAPDGTPLYDTTAGGQPRTLPVTDPGSAVVTVNGGASNTLVIDVGVLADGVVDLVLDGHRAAIVATGSASGGGVPLDAGIEIVVLMDLTLSQAGAELTSNTTQEGAKLEDDDADQVAERIASAGFTASVVNGLPFEVDMDLAFAAGDLGEQDIFALPGSVILNSIVSLTGGLVDGSGRVTGPATSTATIALTGVQARQLLGDYFTARARIRLMPISGSAGRAQIREADVVVFDARADLALSAGGAQ